MQSHMVDSFDVLVSHIVHMQQGHLIGHIGIPQTLTIAHMNGLAIAKGALSQLRCVELALGWIIYNAQNDLLID